MDVHWVRPITKMTAVKPSPIHTMTARIKKNAGMHIITSMTREQATQVMLKVHREGMGVCGVYARDIATTKVEQVIAYARKHQHPLQCVMEET